MGAWQPQYIGLTPSEERLAETVMKLEREVFKLKTPHPLGNRDCIVRIGPLLTSAAMLNRIRKTLLPYPIRSLKNYAIAFSR